MKTSLFRTGAALSVAAASLSLISCINDPYYGGGPGPGYGPAYGGGGYVGGAYGYYDGYYGGSTTTVFVSTGDPNWGYDPVRYCYYDYRRRCYYDPYLYGYYPVGFLPPYVRGVPHPYGWGGRGIIPPPRNIHYGTIPNYRNRYDLLRNSNYNWSRNVGAGRPSPSSSFSTNPRFQGSQPGRPNSNYYQPSRTGLGPSQTFYNRPQGQPSYHQTYNPGSTQPQFHPTYGNQVRPSYGTGSSSGFQAQPQPRYQPSYGNQIRPSYQGGGTSPYQYHGSPAGSQFRPGSGGGTQYQYHGSPGGSGGGGGYRPSPGGSGGSGGGGYRPSSGGGAGGSGGRAPSSQGTVISTGGHQDTKTGR